MVAQRFPHLPVPVRAETITPAIPDSYYKPGKSSKQHGDQMQLSCFWKNPSYDIKQGKNCMKDEEENIKEWEPHADAGNNDKIKIAAAIKFLLAYLVSVKTSYFYSDGDLSSLPSAKTNIHCTQNNKSYQDQYCQHNKDNNQRRIFSFFMNGCQVIFNRLVRVRFE